MVYNQICYRVLESITECYRVLQSVTECYRVLQSVTERYRVLLAHLLGPIFLACWYKCYIIFNVSWSWSQFDLKYPIGGPKITSSRHLCSTLNKMSEIGWEGSPENKSAHYSPFKIFLFNAYFFCFFFLWDWPIFWKLCILRINTFDFRHFTSS